MFYRHIYIVYCVNINKNLTKINKIEINLNILRFLAKILQRLN